jgi:hypothetical protein
MKEENKIGLECIEIIHKKLSRQIDSKQYSDALIKLHQKYPMEGHNPPLTTFQLKNYRTIMQVVTDPYKGFTYWDHLQPYNFEEAAQMYYFYSSREKKEIDFKSRASGERDPGEEG